LQYVFSYCEALFSEGFLPSNPRAKAGFIFVIQSKCDLQRKEPCAKKTQRTASQLLFAIIWMKN